MFSVIVFDLELIFTGEAKLFLSEFIIQFGNIFSWIFSPDLLFVIWSTNYTGLVIMLFTSSPDMLVPISITLSALVIATSKTNAYIVRSKVDTFVEMCAWSLQYWLLYPSLLKQKKNQKQNKKQNKTNKNEHKNKTNKRKLH